VSLRESIATRLLGPELRQLQASAQDLGRLATTAESVGLTLADIELGLEDIGWIRVGTGGREQTDLQPWERKVLVQRSRVYYQRDPLVTQAVRLHTDYTFARPLTFKARDDAVGELIRALLDGPVNRKTIGSLAAQRRQSDRLLVDGERFLACFIGTSDEPVKVRGIDCVQVEEIVTNPEDAEDIWGYKRIWVTPAGKPRTDFYADWDADDDAVDGLRERAAKDQGGELQDPETVRVSQIAMNSIGQRGLPLCAAGLDWSQAHRKFMEDRATITRALAAFAFKKKVKGGPAAVAAMKAPFATDPRTLSNLPPGAGSTWLENEGVDLQQMRIDTGARNAETDARMLKLLFAASTGIAEPFFGNADNSNLATAKTLLRPMELMFAAYQLTWLDWYQQLIQHCIDWAGLAAEDRFVDIDAPPIVEQDIAVLGKTMLDLLAVYPELANVPEVLQYVLTIVGVNNVDEIMTRLEGQPPATEGSRALVQALETVLLEMRGRVAANGARLA